LKGGTVVGGTKQPHDYNPYVDEKARETMLANAAEMYPPIITNGLPPNQGGFQVIGDIVGRRPSRNGGPRVEAEVKDGKTVVHAYGLGGSGIEMSWGVAAEVVRLVEEHREK
jgi:glycine/D-amino acid oxidase-like deaminating enzyme